jgi:prepilin-type processing-associated H-X9-DG protein
MSKEERKKKQKLTISKWANTSFYLGILTWLVVVVGVIFMWLLNGVALRHDFSFATRYIISIIVRSWFLITFFMSVVATICGLISLIYIQFKRSILKGTARAFMGFAFGISYCVIFCFSVHTYYVYLRPKMTKFQCMTNLDSIHKSILMYATDFDYKYPPKDKWCDLLIKHTRINKREFICAGSKSKTGQSSYAINENAITLEPSIMRGTEEPNTPPDIVLLFESELGWNQYGGPELLTFKNHGGKGCNILFTDGRSKFIKSEETTKLKWNPDEDQGE